MTKQDIERLRVIAQTERDAAHAAADAEFKDKMEALAKVLAMLERHQLNVAVSTVNKQFGPLPIRPMTTQRSVPVVTLPLGQATVIDSVRQIIVANPQRLWCVSDIEAELKSRNFVFKAKEPKSTINTALSRLTEQGDILIAAHGKGRQPSFYEAPDEGVDAQSGALTEGTEQKDAAA
jgi:hypothetical protein